MYSFLKRCENRKTHQCWPSIKTIGQAVRMSENTVRKYIRQLEERGLITAEPTEVITKTGEKRNGNLLFTLRPIREVIDEHYASQLAELELATERQRVAKLLRERESPAFGPLFPLFGERTLPILGSLRGTKEKAGESPGAFVAPGRSLPPAVRAVSGDVG